MKWNKLFSLIILACALLMAACGNGPIEPDEIENLIEGEQDRHETALQEIERQEKERQERESCNYKYNYTCCNSCYNDYGYYECQYCTNSCYNNYGDYICNNDYSSSSRYSSSSYNYWDDYYYSSSSSSYYYSSSSEKSESLTKAKTMKFTLTYYRQVTYDWDAFDNAGDPKISFSIKLYDYYETLLATKSTGVLLQKQDIRTWSGTSSTTISIPSATYKIKVCPSVLDVDVSFNDDYSSGYCYSVSSVGTMANYETEYQSDSYASSYKLEWEWYLY